jgi:hypothetical protein
MLLVQMLTFTTSAIELVYERKNVLPNFVLFGILQAWLAIVVFA